MTTMSEAPGPSVRPPDATPDLADRVAEPLSPSTVTLTEAALDQDIDTFGVMEDLDAWRTAGDGVL